MNITSGQKKLALGLGILVVIGGGAAAYLFLDPFAENASPVVVAPKPHVAKPAASPPAATAASAPVAAPVAAPATTPVAAPVAIPETIPAPPVPELPPLPEFSDPIKPARVRPVSPPSVDLRHCLDQPTNEAIAKCAGE